MSDSFDDEWRALGFCYDHNSGGRECRFIGSRAGLLRLADLLREYVSEPSNQPVSEHQHYGPYGNLEVMTWPEPGIDDHAIFGPLPKLAELADLVERHLNGAESGQQIRIREEFAPLAEFTLVLDVRRDGFDPASAAAEIYA